MKRSRSPRYSERFDYEGDEGEGSSPPASSSPSSPRVREDGFQYDVFLSFRGADTRKGFTGHLYYALDDKGIATFIDSEKLEKGQKVEELFGYIERSKIFVPIFSKGYADSKWCLKEIAKIVDCKRLVIPVFFDVEPRDVRHQTGPFANAFRSYFEKENTHKEEVSKWSSALTEAGRISGYNLADTDGNEAKLIRLMVKRILTEASKTSLLVAKHPVGLYSRMENVMEMLDIEAQGDARTVGIHGMGGIGKTTLAKGVYNQISTRFDACSFISNVREVAEQPSGLISLQKQLLRDIFKDENVSVNSISHGIVMIKQRIRSKKALLVLDDVDDESQLDALAGGIDWFCSGSRIIVTTRDKLILRAQKVTPYELKGLDATQSLQLFSWHAFGKEEPTAEFVKLSKEVAATAGGLPLALEIFGSHFFDLKTVKEWKGMLEKLKKYQNNHIHEKLKISYDVLDEEQKKVFLDIACFFIGQEREHAILMWEGCRFFPEITIKVLMHKSLVNINDDTGEFEMHDHIRDMGRKIVQDARSRLWEDDETLDILQNKTGRENVEAIQLGWRGIEDSMSVKAKSLSAMSQLRMLRMGRNVRLEGAYDHFPRMIRWLKWRLYDLASLPSALHLKNIVVLDLSGSSITRVWSQQTSARTKLFGKLKVLKLDSCENLTICPNFMSMPHLEKLYFNGCVKMTKLHPSIGLLKNLTHLELCDCTLLKELPEEIYELTSLEELDLSECPHITTFPSVLGDSKSLEQPLLDKLKILYLCSCEGLTSCPDFMSMPHLERLNFESCENLSELHPSVGHLKSLTHLYLTSCHSLKELPQEIWQLTSLEALDLSYCSQITALPSQVGDSKSLKLPLLGKLEHLSLNYCDNFTICPNFTSMPQLEILGFSSCEKMGELHPSIWLLKNLTDLDLSNCKSLKELPQEVSQLTSLKRLTVDDCYQIIVLPESMRHLKQLNYLSLKECSSLIDVPKYIASLDQLENLIVAGCEQLKFLPQLPPSLTFLDASDCYQLETIAEVSHLEGLQVLDLSGCKRLVDVPGIEQLKCLKKLKLRGCGSLHVSFLEGLQDKVLDKLEVLDLRNCDNLTKSPHFRSMTQLRRLDFRSCSEMAELDPSIGHLKSLTDLVLSNCKSLKELPQEISQLISLEKLDLTGCHQLTALPKSMRRLKQLNWLSLRQCSSLTEIPECICLLLNLQELDASRCESLASLPDSLGNLGSLRKLDLSWTAIEELPNSIVSLDQLETLSVAHCDRLKSLPQFPPSLTGLGATSCTELRTISDVSSAKRLKKLHLCGCTKLVDLPGIMQLEFLRTLDLQGCTSLIDYSFLERVQKANFQDLHEFSISGILTNIGEPACPQSLSFLLPKQFKAGVLYLQTNESKLGSMLSELDESNGASEPDESINQSEEDRGLDSNGWETADETIPSDEDCSVGSVGSEQEDRSVESEEDTLPVDSQGRVVRIKITTDVQFCFSALVKRNARQTFPTATFGRDSELMMMIRQGKFMGDDDAKKRTMMKMLVSIDGCLLLDGDLFTNKNHHIYESDLELCPCEVCHKSVMVKFH